MHVERQQIYVSDKMVQEARSKGITNLSKFVRERLAGYNTTHGGIETKE
jgi:hypothetical protein